MAVPSYLVALGFLATIRETLDTSIWPDVANRVLARAGFDVNLSLGPASTPPVTLVSTKAQTGSATPTIDLTSLPITGGGTGTGTGLKLRFLRITNTGTHDFTIAVGASNGYAIGGTVITVKGGATAMYYFADALGTVGSGAKTLDCTANSGDTINLTFGLG